MLSLNLSPLQQKCLFTEPPCSASCICLHRHMHTLTLSNSRNISTPTFQSNGIYNMVILPSCSRWKEGWHIGHYLLVTAVQLFWFFPLVCNGQSIQQMGGSTLLLKEWMCGWLCGGGNDGFRKMRDCWQGRWECFLWLHGTPLGSEGGEILRFPKGAISAHVSMQDWLVNHTCDFRAAGVFGFREDQGLWGAKHAVSLCQQPAPEPSVWSVSLLRSWDYTGIF